MSQRRLRTTDRLRQPGQSAVRVLLDLRRVTIEMFEQVGRSNGQLTELMIQYLGTLKMPDAMRKSDDMQAYLRTQMHVAEKDLAHALSLAREAGVALPGAALVSQLMARIYVVDDPGRR